MLYRSFNRNIQEYFYTNHGLNAAARTVTQYNGRHSYEDKRQSLVMMRVATM